MNTTDNQDWIEAMPKEVRQGVLLFYVGVGIGILGAVIDPNLRTAGTFGIGLLLFIFVFLIFMVNKISKGRNWARITMLVLFLIGAPFSVLSYIVDFKRAPLLVSLKIIISILQMVSLYLFFTKSSNAWFKADKAESQVE